MGKLTFKGGIHPYEGKELAKNQPVEKYLPKGDMVYLMSQPLYGQKSSNAGHTSDLLYMVSM